MHSISGWNVPPSFLIQAYWAGPVEPHTVCSASLSDLKPPWRGCPLFVGSSSLGFLWKQIQLLCIRAEEGGCLPGQLLWVDFLNLSDGSPQLPPLCIQLTLSLELPRRTLLTSLVLSCGGLHAGFPSNESIDFHSLRTSILLVYWWHLSYFKGLFLYLFVCLCYFSKILGRKEIGCSTAILTWTSCYI